MNEARQAEQTARDEVMEMSTELAKTRGWIIDELEQRMSPEKFDAWIFTDGDAVDPFPFLIRK